MLLSVVASHPPAPSLLASGKTPPYWHSLAAKAGVSNSRADIVYHTIFLSNDTRKWADAPIIRPVQPHTLRLIPDQAEMFSMIELRCNGVQSNGRLTKCRVSPEPVSDQLNAIGRSATADILIEPSFSRSVQGKVRFISIQLKVSNSAVPVWRGPCWPPTCASGHVPPPNR